jgi:protein TonB
VREEQVQHHHIVESVAQNADVLKHAVQSEPVQAAESLQKADVIQKTPAVEATAVEPVLAAPSVRQLVQAEPSTQVSPRPSAVTHAEPLETHTPVPLQHAAVQQREAQTVESPAPLPQTAHAAEPNRQVMERPAVVTAQTKMDYSWLTQELLTRLERSKRYPYTARLNRWEGRVVVKAVVRDDGQVVSLQIAESSGHAVLDNDAMELIRQVSPIQLKYPLGKAQVALLVPVGYSLH